MFSLILFFVLLVSFALYITYLWDVEVIMKELKKARTYVPELSLKQYATQVYWQRAEADLKVFKTRFKRRFPMLRYYFFWNVVSRYSYKIIPVLNLELFKSPVKPLTIKIEFSWWNRFFSVYAEVHWHKLPSYRSFGRNQSPTNRWPARTMEPPKRVFVDDMDSVLQSGYFIAIDPIEEVPLSSDSKDALERALDASNRKLQDAAAPSRPVVRDKNPHQWAKEERAINKMIAEEEKLKAQKGGSDE